MSNQPVALVTGAGSGIGRRAARRWAADGWIVAAIDVDESGLEQTAQGHDAIKALVCDVTDWATVEKVVAEVSVDHGPIDKVVAAAGIGPSGLVLDMEADVFKQVMEVDYLGVVHTVKATLPGMTARRTGDIVVFASLMGLLPTMHYSAYCAAKAAVRSFAEVVHRENLHSGVKIACVCPPMVDTAHLDQPEGAKRTRARAMTPDEVLDAVDEGMAKGKFLITPGPARGASVAARLLPAGFWDRIERA